MIFYVARDSRIPLLHKVGLSANPPRRIKEVGTENGRKMTLVLTREFTSASCARLFERYMIFALKKYHYGTRAKFRCAVTEHFKVSLDTIEEAMDSFDMRYFSFGPARKWPTYGNLFRDSDKRLGIMRPDVYGPKP